VGPSPRARLGLALAVACSVAVTGPARAEPPAGRVELGAREAVLDPGSGELALRRGVVVAFERYRLTSDELRLRVVEGGVAVEGPGRLAACPCPDPPIALAFQGARLDRAGDVTLTWPRVELGGVPVLVSPWLWLRGPDRVGLLPPLVAWRADGGLLLGGGVHVPFAVPRVAAGFLDVTAAGLSRGGAEIGARLDAGRSSARVEWGRLGGDRVLVDARGVVGASPRDPGEVAATLAWDVDALRGARAKAGTIDLEAVARPLDSARAEASATGTGAGGVGLLGAVGVTGLALRGADPLAVGPTATVAGGGGIGRSGAFDLSATGLVAAGDAVGGAPLPLARARFEAEVAPRAGPVAIRLGTLELARFAGRGDGLERAPQGRGAGREASVEGLASLRAAVGVPLVRAFAAAPGEAPLVHRIEPVVEARGALAAGAGSFFSPIGGALAPASLATGGGLGTSLGRWGGPAATLEARAGALTEPSTTRPFVRARLAASALLVGSSVEVAAAGGAPSGVASVARLRLGRVDGVRLVAGGLALAGGGAREARSASDGGIAAAPGEALAWGSAAGVRGDAGLTVPFARVVTASARAFADLGAPALLGVRGELGWRHPCGCLGVTAVGTGRAGRPGADAWLALDLAPR
jgi:hypothetical protein